MDLPEWWDWERELTPHLLKRVTDRSISETDLRVMMEQAVRYRPSAIAGRFVIETSSDGTSWELVVEPDELDRLLVVVTGYPVGGGRS